MAPWRIAVAALTLLVGIAAGVFLLGRVAVSQQQAMLLTGAFFGAVAVGVLVVGRRRRRLLVALGSVFAVAVVTVTALLGRPLLTQSVAADEGVAELVAAAPAPASAESAVPAAPPAVAGSFAPVAHPGEGTATVVTVHGRQVLAFTEFRTDNGPDLRVYLVPPDAPSGTVERAVDLGALHGNVGNQRYDVPADVVVGEGWRVSVWCRAFAVGFTEAVLAGAPRS
ncbi:MAG: DM13 domain-containing protein [Actinomycetes bacterium]